MGYPCGPDSQCLNRMLMYECHPSTCPAGELCENQRFQRRSYPPLEVFKTEKSGWGLRVKESMKKVSTYYFDRFDIITVECRYNMVQYCMNYHPLFRVRSWNNGMRCMSPYILFVRYYINNYRKYGRISTKCWIRKRHPINRPNGWAMGCLLWILLRRLTNGTALCSVLFSSNLVMLQCHGINWLPEWGVIGDLCWCLIHSFIHCHVEFPGRFNYTPSFNKVERGVYWFHLVGLSICGQNRVRSVSSKIFVGSISYMHILSSNFRRCVVCNVCFKI